MIRFNTSKSLWLIFTLSSLFTHAQTVKKELHQNWQYKEANNVKWYPATVPGCIHTDLIANKKLPDPYWRDNEKWVQWVTEMSWDYKTNLNPSEALRKHRHLEIDFEGLDTYAEVFIEGNPILKADNMFVKWKRDITKLIGAGDNELLIKFRSPTKEAMADYYLNPITLPATNEDGRVKLSPYTRKAGYQYGWDWGPRLVTSGVWRPVKLTAWTGAIIRDVQVQTLKADAKEAMVKVSWIIEADTNMAVNLSSFLGTHGMQSALDIKTGKNTFEQVLRVKNPRLWWPNGWGEAYLYPGKFTLLEGRKALQTEEEKIGIRTVDLVHEMDKWGKSFYFKVNGTPIFMKGANFIPIDNFVTRADRSRYRNLLSSAKAANMNMLRVWGGGIYEQNDFYQLCDSLGLMVWQDFMFACSMYPGSDSFRENVRREVTYNVRRLRNYACIALWCGNNENETGWFKRWMRGRIPYSDEDSAIVYNDHKFLFHEMIPEIVGKEDPLRFYHRSSPSANDDNILPDKKGFGDTHDWYVWFGTGDYRAYEKQVSRFQSEFGYQSFPDFETIKKFSVEKDWYEDSDVMDVHQKHTNGNEKIRRFAEQFYPKPKNFRQFIYISQLQQAEAMRFATEVHRRNMPYCMGSLYWQLNDCWPVASWASTDYYGRWKAVHYAVQKANQPFLLTFRLARDSLFVFSVTDNIPAGEGELAVRVIDFSGTERSVKKMKVSWATNASKRLTGFSKKDILQNPDSASIFIEANLSDTKGMLKASKHYLQVLPKALNLPKPNMTWKVVQKEGKNTLIVSSPQFVKNVHFYIKDGEAHFSNNYFDLLPGVKYEVDVQINSGTVDNVTVESLWDCF